MTAEALKQARDFMATFLGDTKDPASLIIPDWCDTDDFIAGFDRAWQAVNAELNRRPLPSSGAHEALEEAQKAMKLLEELTACGADDDYVSGVQKKIADALASLPSSGDLEAREALAEIARFSLVIDSVIRYGPDERDKDKYADISEAFRRARSVLASLQEGGDRGGEEIREILASVKIADVYGKPYLGLVVGDGSFWSVEWPEEGLGVLERWKAKQEAALSASPARPGGVGVYEENLPAILATSERLIEKRAGFPPKESPAQIPEERVRESNWQAAPFDGEEGTS